MTNIISNKNHLFTKLIILITLVVTLYSACLISYGKQPFFMEPNYVAQNYIMASAPITSNVSALNYPKSNPFDSLNVPTYFTKVENTYFIVDCYHNQVIYHNNLSTPISQWNVMTSDINMGHTLASDGLVYLVDDTENNRILVLEKRTNDNGQVFFIPTQEFTDIGNRPHYIIYDVATDTFYAWSSNSGEMFLFKHNKDNSTLYLTEIRTIESLNNIYVRSFTIIGNDIYFVSGNSSIIRADLSTFNILEEYPVPAELYGMIQITQIEDYFYITISTDASGNQDYATLIRTKSLSALASGDYEDIYHYFVGGGTPYNITYVDEKWFLTEHRLPTHSLWSFTVEDNKITDVIDVY